MTILLSVLVIVAGVAIFHLARVLMASGFDGFLYLSSARLHACGDAVRAGKREYRRVLPTYRAQALSASAVTDSEPEAAA